MRSSNIPVKRSSTSMRPMGPMNMGTDLDRLENRFNQLWDNFFSIGSPSLWRDMERNLEESIYPPVEVKETNEAYTLEADIPGMKEDEIELDFHDNVLTLKGEKTVESKERNKGMLKSERYYGSFRRDIPFQDEVDGDMVKANLKDGVLTIELPKKPEQVQKHKKIKIKS